MCAKTGDYDEAFRDKTNTQWHNVHNKEHLNGTLYQNIEDGTGGEWVEIYSIKGFDFDTCKYRELKAFIASMINEYNAPRTLFIDDMQDLANFVDRNKKK